MQRIAKIFSASKPHFINLGRSLINALFPRYCCVCGRRLLIGERDLCLTCLINLPYTHINGERGNVLERIFWNPDYRVERADSLLYYHSKAQSCNIYFQFKYYHHPEIAVHFGEMMAQNLIHTDFFDGIDCIVPIPLAPKRLKKRGYNQSERLAHGISLVTNIPVDTTSVIRTTNNGTQTHLTAEDRAQNVSNIFALSDTPTLAGKHVLIVDDVITTGSTTKSCVKVIAQLPDVKFSILSLGLSTRNKKRNIVTWKRK